ncbi:MAG: hypothetical protein KGV50_06745 [Gammaproteobacteria bacterium]|nr:hypothetical protein [Gammaproteobacteria bacterium]
MKRPVKYLTSLFSLGVISLSLSLLSLPAYAEKTMVIKPTIKAEETKAEDAEKNEGEIIIEEEKPKEKTLILTQKPSETALSVANKELLTENNKLKREITDLQTQVNVLVNERGGQLFLYGAFTALISFFIGGFLSWFFLARSRSRW